MKASSRTWCHIMITKAFGILFMLASTICTTLEKFLKRVRIRWYHLLLSDRDLPVIEVGGLEPREEELSWRHVIAIRAQEQHWDLKILE